MIWESPIYMNYKHHIQEINKAIEGEIMKAVVAVGVDVDKERLLKALQNSKSFYEEGYADGKRDTVKHGTWIDGADSFGGKRGLYRVCGHCNICIPNTIMVPDVYWQYCPNCGAKMDLEGGFEKGFDGMRLIDADALKEKLLKERDAIPLTYTERYCFGVEFPSGFGQARRGGVKAALRCMEQTPTIDAVPVVRCKDCTYCDPENRHCDHPMGTIVPVPRKADDFCSYGERKGG